MEIWKSNPPLENMVLNRIATELEEHPVVNRNICCSNTTTHAHLPVVKGIFRLCVPISTWFGIPARITPENKHVHGNPFVATAKMSFSDLKRKEIDEYFFKQRLTNLVVDLSNFEEAPWNRIHKSKKKMIKQNHNIRFVVSDDPLIENYFTELFEWISSRHGVSKKDEVDLSLILRIYQEFCTDPFLYGLFIDGNLAACTIIIKDPLNRTAFFMHHGFSDKYSEYSPGIFLFYKLIELLKTQKYDTFDLGSGHHGYKYDVASHYYLKKFDILSSKFRFIKILLGLRY
jgi:hypothetical protein